LCLPPSQRNFQSMIGRASATIAGIFRSLRPRSWTKNLFVFAAVLFGRQWSPAAILSAALGALAFSLLAGSVYLLNDVMDRKRDGLHPEKRLRPVASGALSPGAALAAAVVIAGGVLGASFTLAPRFAVVGVSYLALQAMYSLGLKQVVILDSLVIAMGFVLRALAGAELAADTGLSITLSPWLFMCTFFLALFLAFSKRRAEVVSLGDSAREHRSILREYTPHLLDEMIGVATAASLMSFAIYTVSERTAQQVSPMLWTTIPFVAFGIFRYLFLVHTRGLGGSPDRIVLTDKPLLANIVLWLAAVMLILSFFPPSNLP
jgi:4-hydroxybenzoate polyprenyltransferase